MKKLLVIMGLALVAGGCATKPQIQTEYKFVVVEPPETFLNCPGVPSKPNHATLTNQEVVNYINRLEKSLLTCGVNLAKAKDYITEVKKLYD